MRPARGDGWSSRAPHPRAQPDGAARHRSGKNTKRWCLGRVGREHVGRYEPTEKYAFGKLVHYPSELPLRCVNCRKILPSKVSAWRKAMAWVDADGRWLDYNTGAPGTRPVMFYGPGLPSSC